MSQFALGLTKTAVEGTLSRVKSAIDEETKLKERVQNDLVFITGEFEMMQSFLKGANAAECAKNEVVRTWVRQIRDLAFDVEDCVEFVVHLDKTPPWTSWFWRVVPSCIAPVLPLDVAVSEIKQLKARVVDVSDRNTRYNLISSNSDSNTNSKPAVAISSPAPELMPATSLTFHMLSEAWQAAGKHRGTGDLPKLITSPGSDLQVISVWGCCTGGAAFHHLGETSIIRKAYDDPAVCRDFSSRAWIKLMHPFNPRKFLKSLLTQLQARSHQANKDTGQVDHLWTRMKAALGTEDDLNTKVELMQKLRDQRYLIVLEELSTMVEWDIIRTYLPDSQKGSRIVVSTQRLGIALSCTGKPYQVADLGRFSDGQSLCAFFNKGCQLYGYGGKDASILFSNRMKEASKWPKTLLVGDQCRASRRLDEVIDDTDAGVVSIWGIAGVGKSCVAKTVYYNQLSTSNRGPMHGYRSFSWVDVPYPFNLSCFSRLLFLDFHSDDLQAKEAAAIDLMEGQDPIEGCRKFLRECKCLVVIDGLRSTHDWNLIKDTFLSDPIQGCILVITNEACVARYCARDLNQVINVKALEPEVALPLLRKIAASGDKCRKLKPEEMEVSELIIAKCGGLPQVITAVGEYFSEQSCPVEYLSDHFMGSLKEIPAFHSLRGLFSWMQSYFDACSDSLKPCIFYLSVFPIDHNIRRRRLLRRWVAESYSRDKFGRASQLHGENLFFELVKLSIIQQSRSSRSGSSKVDVCQVNGFFHEYIMSRPMEDNLVFALEWHDGMNLQPAGGQHLTVRSNWERDEIEFQSLDLSRLRSLTVFGEWRSFFLSTNMRLLRVLDLEDASGIRDDDLEHIGKQVPRLKFLSLRGCKDVTCLPDSLGDMRQLQTLDVRHTQITTLPHAIVKLVKLQHVRAGTTHGPPEADGRDRYTAVPPLTVAEEDDVNETSDGDKCQRECLQHVPAAEDGDGTALVLAEMDEFCTPRWMSRRAREFVVSCSRMSTKFTGRVSQLVIGNQIGVRVPASGMGKLIALHTLGVINVTCSGKAILEELKTLTQLRKLGVSGINMGNIQELFRAISDHPHLKSLSVRVDKEDDYSCLDDTISLQPPKTLERLKLHGDVTVLPVWGLWIKQFPKPRKVDLEVTVSTQKDIDAFDDFPPRCGLRRLYVKPLQDGELHFGNTEEATCIWRVLSLKVLKIDCSSSRKSQVTFYKLYPLEVEVLKIHCSSGSVLRISGIQHLQKLKEVLLKGSYDDQLKQDLLNQLSRHKNKPVLKVVVQPCSS